MKDDDIRQVAHIARNRPYRALKTTSPVTASHTEVGVTETTINVDIPKGRKAMGISLKVRVTPVVTGTGTAYVSEYIDSVKVTAKGKTYPSIDLKGGSLCLAAAFSAARAGVAPGLRPSEDTLSVATATAVWLYARLYNYMPGRSFKIVVGTKAMTALTGFTSPVSINCSIVASVLYGTEHGPDEVLKGNYASLSSIGEDNVKAFALSILNAEISSIVGSLSHGGKSFGALDIQHMENLANQALLHCGEAFATPTDAVYVPGIIAWNHATQRLFAVYYESDVVGPLTCSKTAGNTAVVWVQPPPTRAEKEV